MKIVVTANAFSKNEVLVNHLIQTFEDFKIIFNTSGRYSKEELISNLQDADGAIVGLDKIDESILSECQNLKVISKYGVGLDNINLEDCKKYNVKVGWTGGVNKLSVAEMTLGYMLMLCRNLFTTSNELKNGIWNKSGGFQLSGKKIGIIGVGHIGKEVIRLLKPFNCEILVNDIINQDEFYKENNLIEVSKEEIFKTCDIVTIHTPFNDTTNNLIDKKIFEMMKTSSFIINSARGGIINENDLKYALQNKLIAGASIDAYVEEPPTDKELLVLPNLICTPHIGGNANEAVEAMGMSAIEHLKEYFKDKR